MFVTASGHPPRHAGGKSSVLKIIRLPSTGSASKPPPTRDGALAQLVEHLHGMQGVSGSNPLRSTFLDSRVYTKVWG